MVVIKKKLYCTDFNMVETESRPQTSKSVTKVIVVRKSLVPKGTCRFESGLRYINRRISTTVSMPVFQTGYVSSILISCSNTQIITLPNGWMTGLEGSFYIVWSVYLPPSHSGWLHRFCKPAPKGHVSSNLTGGSKFK